MLFSLICKVTAAAMLIAAVVLPGLNAGLLVGSVVNTIVGVVIDILDE